MTAGWTRSEYHTSVFKPSSLPLFSPNYSHSLSITPHNSGKLSNGRNNSNFNLSVPVVSTKKMLSRTLRLRLPPCGGQRGEGRAPATAPGRPAENRARRGAGPGPGPLRGAPGVGVVPTRCHAGRWLWGDAGCWKGMGMDGAGHGTHLGPRHFILVVERRSRRQFLVRAGFINGNWLGEILIALEMLLLFDKSHQGFSAW